MMRPQSQPAADLEPLPIGEKHARRSAAEALERARLRVVLGTVLLNVVAVALLTFLPGSNWRTGLALNLLDNVILVGISGGLWILVGYAVAFLLTDRAW